MGGDDNRYDSGLLRVTSNNIPQTEQHSLGLMLLRLGNVTIMYIFTCRTTLPINLLLINSRYTSTNQLLLISSTQLDYTFISIPQRIIFLLTVATV